MQQILVLDDLRTFADSDTATYTHVRTNACAIEAFQTRRFDELWLDYDLSATEGRYATSKATAMFVRDAQREGELLELVVSAITDLEIGRTRLRMILSSIVMSNAGHEWNRDVLGIDTF